MAPASRVDDSGKVGKAPEFEKSEQDLESLFEYIDEKHGFLINRLRDFVEFQTVASDPSKKNEFPRMADYVVEILKKFGIRSTVMNMIETGEDDARAEGDVVPLILAETEIDPSKRTALFYCHYDVYPINYQECWVDPFELMMTQDDSELHGKGTSAGKGPFLCIINAIGAYQKKKLPLPVNVKIILDPMGTVDDDVTGKFLRRIDTDFFFNVDFVCLSNGRWLGNTRPCVTHGARGTCYFTVEVEGPSKDLHSGSYGGLFNEPMADVVYILNGLVDKNGVIRVTDIYEDVPPVTEEEKKFFKSVHFSVRDFQQEIGATELQVNEDKAALLMRLWRQPSLTIHGIHGAFSNPGTKGVIPGKVTGKFSINIVPNMSPSKVKKKVVDYLAKVWKARKSNNKIRVQMTVGKLFWHTDPSDLNVIAAKNAVTKVYNSQPDLIRQPNRIRIAQVLRKMTGAPVVMIPIGKSNDISDANSEKLDVINYINGCKIYSAYMKYLAELFPTVKTPEDMGCTCKITGQLESCKCYMQYIPPPEEETDRRSSDWSLSLSPEMIGDEKPGFRYYYLSLQAMKKMQKLQEVISTSHLVPIGSTLQAHQDGEGLQEVHSSMEIKSSRMTLASFSVPNLHDESKPWLGGWLPKPVASNMAPGASASLLKPPESSTRVIPDRVKITESAIAALQPTVFSFQVAQSLKRYPSEKFQVLTDIRSAKAGLADRKIVSSQSDGGVQTTSSQNNKVNGEIKTEINSGSKSAPDLLAASQKLRGERSVTMADSYVGHPNVLSPVNPSAVMSSTSQILYKKRLNKMITESTESLKSASPSLRIHSTRDKITLLSADTRSPESASPSDVPSSMENFKPDEIGIPGSPIKPFQVISSLSKVFYEKRATNESVIPDSMQAMKSGLQMAASSFRNTASSAVPPSVSPNADPAIESATSPPSVGSEIPPAVEPEANQAASILASSITSSVTARAASA